MLCVESVRGVVVNVVIVMVDVTGVVVGVCVATSLTSSTQN